MFLLCVLYKKNEFDYNGWVFMSVLPCTNVQITDKAQRQNCINTVLGVVASTALDTKDKTFFVLKF
jgi:hypothetical protein